MYIDSLAQQKHRQKQGKERNDDESWGEKNNLAEHFTSRK